jgi:MFS family permease
MDGLGGWRAWRWLFLIEGVITVAIALGAYFVLPNFPRTTSWLSEEEKALAIWRLEEDVGQDDWVSSGEQSLFNGFKLALLDVKTWVLVSRACSSRLANCGVRGGALRLTSE